MLDDGSSPKNIKVVLRDLDVLLRKKFGDSLIVDSFKTSSLVPPGENYGSTMLRVDAVVRRDGVNSEPEELYLVAKMAPPTEYQRMLFDSPFTFRKEMYMFAVIMPAFKALERESGIPETEVFDLLPEFYDSRMSLEEGEDKFDDDAVILMESLIPKNYVCMDRKIGVAIKHAELVIEAMARFHALGIATKLKKSEFFEEIRIYAKYGKVNTDLITEVFESLINDAKKIPELLPHLHRVEEAVHSINAKLWLVKPTEPWSTIAHAELWTNNLMFCHDAKGNPGGIKFIDFQNYSYQNPMQDLIFFISTSCRNEVFETQMWGLIDLYYEKLTSHLARLDCDLIPFSRESFDKQLAIAATVEYTHCLIMAKVVTANTDTDPGVTNLERMFDGNAESNDVYLKLISEITLRFVKENWI